MKKSIALLAVLCLMMTPVALSEGTISGEAFQEAQYIPALLETVESYSYSSFVYGEEGELEYADTFWFGKAENGTAIVYHLDSDGNSSYIANGMSVNCDADGDCKVLVYTQPAYEVMLEELFSATMIYLADEIKPYRAENGDMVYVYSDSGFFDYCSFDADSLRLIEFSSNLIVDGEAIRAEQISTQVDLPLVLPDRLREALDGRTRNVVIHTPDGGSMEYTVLADMEMYLLDESFEMTLSLNADMTTLVECLRPGFDAEVWVYAPAE